MKITYADKDSTAGLGSPSRKWRDDDANEIKQSVNDLYDTVDGVSVQSSNTDDTLFGVSYLNDWTSGYINTSGVIASSGSYAYSDFIAVSEGQVFRASLSGSASVLVVSAYSSADQGDFVPGSAINTAGSSSPASAAVELSFTIPSGVTHIRVCRHNDTESTSVFLRIGEGLNGDVSGVRADMYDEVQAISWVSGYVNSSGVLSSTSSYQTSGFLSVVEGEKYQASLSGSASVLIVSAYASNDESDFISDSILTIAGGTGSGSDDPIPVAFVVPPRVKYIRVVRHVSTADADVYLTKNGVKDTVSRKVIGVDNTGGKRRVISRRKAVFAFVWDDLNDSDELVHEIFKEYGYSAGFALHANQLSVSNYETYLNMYRNGASILSHGNSGYNTEASMTESKQRLESLGFVCSGWVTNGSTLPTEDIPTVKKYYGYAFTASPPAKDSLPGSGFDESVDPCEMARVGLEAWNLDEGEIQPLKDMVDHAITNDMLVVFYGHEMPSTYLNTDGETSRFTESDLRALLQYLADKRNAGLCEVLAPDEAVYQYYSGIIF